MVLRSRRVKVSSVCPLCNNVKESDIRCLISCTYAKDYWLLSDVGWWGLVTTIVDWFQLIMTRCSRELCCEAMVVAWEIWNARNNMVWNHKLTTTASLVIHQAMTFIRAWQAAQIMAGTNGVATQQHFVTKWESPPLQHLKINVDASFDINSKVAGAGWIVEDSVGWCKGGKIMSLGFVSNALMAEVLSIREVLSWLKEKNFEGAMHIESDSLPAIQALQRTVVDCFYFGTLISNCQTLANEFSALSFSFVKKSAN
ncbi:uncharacterized protein LOC119370680 [Jatropha curcas]|uniref:uncharacterized protein LOC119370680 n=1 Tax=Jatropha curcas TaxID=180498 RepID=UPI00189580DD|nr:uncharacterized protein LOC119370680 [Jatropha curcas]